MITPDQGAIERFVQDYRAATGDDEPLAGVFAFDDSPEMADELAALVREGPKRATAGALLEYQAEGAPIPEAGELSCVHDGRGAPVVLIRTLEVRCGPLDQLLDPAFAWDEGEGDRTMEDWLEGHTRYWTRTLPKVGAQFAPDIDVVLERFAVEWPDPDVPRVLADRAGMDVRFLRHDDRLWSVAAGLPALVAREGHEPVGLLTFRPRPGVVTEVVTLDTLQPRQDAEALMREAISTLAREQGWQRLEMPTS